MQVTSVGEYKNRSSSQEYAVQFKEGKLIVTPCFVYLSDNIIENLQKQWLTTSRFHAQSLGRSAVPVFSILSSI